MYLLAIGTMIFFIAETDAKKCRDADLFFDNKKELFAQSCKK